MSVATHEQGGMSLAYLHGLTEPTAKYAQYEETAAWGILRNGMVEEGIEAILGYKHITSEDPAAYEEVERTDLSPEETRDKAGEIGDGLYYFSEISRHGNADHDEALQGYPDLTAFQRANPGVRTPIYGPGGELLTLEQDRRAVLGMTILRTVDVLNPQTPALWLGINERKKPSLGTALGDTLGAYTFIATQHGIDIVDTIWYTLNKLKRRERQPDVIAQAERQNMLASKRERLYVVPWIGRLISQAGDHQWTDVTGQVEDYRNILP